MAIFVINEWLWADAGGARGADGQRQALLLITRLAASEDQIVVVVGSAFDRKTWACCKSLDLAVRGIAASYITVIRQNSDRCRLLNPDQTNHLPEALAAEVKPDDHYLVQAQLTVPGAILITTDAPLREVVLKAGLPCQTRDEFLTTYEALG